jgi:hypothetical protein
MALVLLLVVCLPCVLSQLDFTMAGAGGSGGAPGFFSLGAPNQSPTAPSPGSWEYTACPSCTKPIGCELSVLDGEGTLKCGVGVTITGPGQAVSLALYYIPEATLSEEGLLGQQTGVKLASYTGPRLQLASADLVGGRRATSKRGGGSLQVTRDARGGNYQVSMFVLIDAVPELSTSAYNWVLLEVNTVNDTAPVYYGAMSLAVCSDCCPAGSSVCQVMCGDARLASVRSACVPFGYEVRQVSPNCLLLTTLSRQCCAADVCPLDNTNYVGAYGALCPTLASCVYQHACPEAVQPHVRVSTAYCNMTGAVLPPAPHCRPVVSSADSRNVYVAAAVIVAIEAVALVIALILLCCRGSIAPSARASRATTCVVLGVVLPPFDACAMNFQRPHPTVWLFLSVIGNTLFILVFFFFDDCRDSRSSRGLCAGLLHTRRRLEQPRVVVSKQLCRRRDFTFSSHARNRHPASAGLLQAC